jgi:sulfoquinovosidase
MRALRSLPLAALLGCSATESLAPAPAPLDVGPSFSVAVQAPARLVVSSADGRVLLDGLPPAKLASDDAPPLVGFAVRDVATTYDMMFGTFMPTVTPNGPWRVAEELVPSEGGGLALQDASGAVLATMTFTTPEAGHLVAAIEPGAGPEHHLTWGFACAANDHFAGFGAQSLDVDHRGFTVPTWTEEQGVGKVLTDTYGPLWFLVGTRHASYFNTPQYLSSRGYILTTDTPHRALFDVCSTSASDGSSAARIEIELPAVVHVFDGPTPAQAMERATATFGRPRMPPKVAFAPWLDAIFGSANVRAVAAKLRAAGIPTSVLWTEDWRGGDWSGDDYTLKEEWQVDTTLYPDMPALSSDLHDEGFDFFVYFNSFVYESSAAWPETEPYGYLIKHPDGTDYTFTGAKLTTTGLLDLDNPAARAWAVDKMQAAIGLGADGWMNDFGEWLPTDGVTFAGPSEPRHNGYPLQWQQVARDAIDGVNDGNDRLFFARSGWLGNPPLADVVWAGDQRTDFEADDGLPTILPIGIGLGIAGVSTYGTDIAGYQSATNPTSTKELFFRWTEIGAWSPVMRTHHGTEPLLEWSWQSDVETTGHFSRYARLHMSLVPYLEGLAQVASATGTPMWRGLMVQFPGDEASWGVKDEVMLGGGILLAPVLIQGVTARSVYLPSGGPWYPWAGGASIAGAATIDAQAPMTEIPVYAAAGAVVPTYPGGVMTLVHGSAEVPDASSVGDDRIVYAFLGADGSFEEIDGLGYAVKQLGGAAGKLSMTWQGAAVPACAASVTTGCFAATADGATAYVTGPGTLVVTAGGKAAAELTATGGDAARNLTWVVRR